MAEKLESFSLKEKTGSHTGIQKVGIVGCGSMGQEIAQAVAKAGLDVIFIDISKEKVSEVYQQLEWKLDKMINRWGLTHSEKKSIISKINGSADYKDLAGCNLVIETINTKKAGTNADERREVFKKIEEVISPNAIIASNTATMVISELASALSNPERAVGLHFLSPLTHSDVVEVVRSLSTTEEAFEEVVKFVRMISKQPVVVSESPGNISTRMLVPMINEACLLLMEGVGTVADIDEVMKELSGHRYGPFELADKIGLDILQKWMDNLYAEFGDQRFQPSPIIKRFVRAGLYGQRVSEGFYKYEKGKPVSKPGSILTLGRE